MSSSSAAAAAPASRVARGGGEGGVYVPPHRARAAAASSDPASEDAQRASWERLRKSINGLVNKVTVANLVPCVGELFRLNLVRGRGLLVRALMKAQLASPGFSHVYAALAAVLNTKLPEVGDLLLRRTVAHFRRAFRRNNKTVAAAAARLLAHLVNHAVAHELAALQLATLLLAAPTDDSVELALGFVRECGATLTVAAPAGLAAIFDRLRAVLHEGDVDKRVAYMIEALFAVRKAKFAEHPAVLPDLDLVERDDQITHDVPLDEADLDTEDLLDIFAPDPDYAANEAAWAEVYAKAALVAGSAEGVQLLAEADLAAVLVTATGDVLTAGPADRFLRPVVTGV
jgi:pre-mRNA-splicing factor CWC22